MERDTGRAPDRERAGVGSGASSAATSVVVVESGHLSDIVTSAVAAALLDAGLGGDGNALGASRLLDRSELALAFDVSPGFVDKLRRQGMPCLYLGDSPRFELEPCLGWLRAQKRAAP